MGIPYAEVIGDPIAHSKSPVIHRFWLGKLGLKGDYRRAHIRSGDLPSYLVERRTDPDWRGCNVTMPHKAEIAKLLDTVDSSAGRIGAVNTVIRDNEELAGVNTDWQGLNMALAEHSADGKDVVLVGAGGAARAALELLSRAKPRSLAIMNRDPRKAAALLAHFGLVGESLPLGDPPPADLLINASPLGMAGYPPLEIGLSALRPGAVVLDMVYHPLDTRLLQQARSQGLFAIDGLQMLIWQAAIAFRHFFRTSLPEPADGPELRELLTR